MLVGDGLENARILVGSREEREPNGLKEIRKFASDDALPNGQIPVASLDFHGFLLVGDGCENAGIPVERATTI